VSKHKAKKRKPSAGVAEVLAQHKAWADSQSKNSLAKRGKVPLSESLNVNDRLPDDVQDAMTAEDVIAILRGMAENDPTRVISRNYFRCHSRIRESTWNRYYGTFEEFKKQAGIKLSRQVHKLEREIAKHASVDHYRQLEKERAVWGDKYDRPSGKRYQTILAASDFHDKDCDPFALRVFLDVAERAKDIITTVCLAGDIFDLSEFGKFTQDPRDWGVTRRIKFVHNSILEPLRKSLPKAQIDFIEGNHEARLLRHLGDATPSMKDLLAELHGFDIPKLLGLDTYQLNYIGRGSLAAWTKRDMEKEIERNYKVYFDCVLAHHFPKIGQKKGLPGFSGHHHKLQVWPLESPLYGPSPWYQMGAMHVRDASYTDGERWSNGFLLVHVDTKTKRSAFEYIDIGDHAYAGGKFYERLPSERVIKTV